MIAAILIIYVIVLVAFLRKLVELKAENTSVTALPMSIIIPFRGEISELEELLTDINRQKYGLENIEVLVINDSDQPLLLASEKFAFSLQIRDTLSRKGKKAAIDLGISYAKNEYILCLDADIRISIEHLNNFARAFSDRNDLVIGVLHFAEMPKSFSNYFECYEYYGMQAVTQSSVLLENSLLCSGANLGFTKETYLKTHEIRTDFEIESGDDMFLLQAAKKLKLKIGLASGSALLRYQSDFNTIIKQRIRWGAKSVLYKNGYFIGFTLLVAIAIWAEAWVLATAVLGKTNWVNVLAVLMKIGADFALVRAFAKRVQQNPKFRIDVVLAYPFITAYLSLGALLGKTTWKNRSIKR